MARALLLVLLALAGAGVQAQQRPLADDPGCRAALTALDARTAQRAPKPELEVHRRRAAAACLGGNAAASPPAARVRTPQAVAPVVPRPVAVPAPLPAPPAKTPRSPLLTLGACDATGCWASDGTRLSRAGANQLLGPRGLCSVQGSLIHCPP
jgi:hypothetical protein